MAKPEPIHAIPCRLRTAKMRRVVRGVLDQILDRNPDDFRALQHLVREIVPLSREQQRDGTRGEWKPVTEKADDPSTWGDDQNRIPGKVLLAESFFDEKEAVANAAMSLAMPARGWKIW